MRLRRLIFVFTAFYFVFIGGSAYYTLVFPVRLFHHFFVTVLLGWWLFNRIRSGRGLPYTPLNLPIYALVAVWLITALASIDRRMAFENVWFLIIHSVIFFVLVDLFQRGRQKLVLETQFILAAVVVFITGLELASWYFGLGITPGTEVGWIDVVGPGAWLPMKLPRVSLAMNISTLLAGYVAPLITLTAGWAMTMRRKDYRNVLWGLTLALTVILLLTFSRGGMLSLAAAATTLFIAQIIRVTAIRKMISPRLFIAGAAVSGIILLAVFMIVLLSGRRGSGDEGRLDMYRSAVEMTLDYPVFGVGPGIYGRAFRDYRDPRLARDKLASAHNFYLNTAAETGILGSLVTLWAGIVLVRTWVHKWTQEASPSRKLRLEAVFAALIGVGVHSMVDVFTTTPIVLMILGLLAYSVTGHRSVFDDVTRGSRWPALAALGVLLAYGAWFVQLDRAYTYHMLSLANDDKALDFALAAEEIDPSLNLYDLRIAYLIGRGALDADGEPDEAISFYESALAMEPTWDTGWMNLAALHLAGNGEVRALDALERAYAINPLTTSSLHLARLQDQFAAAPPQTVIELYVDAMALSTGLENRLPLAEFWTQTALRREALELFAASRSLDLQYRIWSAHDPERAWSLVPQSPESAAEWWVAGEYALTVERDAARAVTCFSEAIARARTNGDYYVSRARAALSSDPERAARDLDFAALLGVRFEYPGALRAEMADSPEEARHFRVRALPPRPLYPEFSAVLYGGRIALFELFPEMRFPGPGHAAMQPWYIVAEGYERDGRITDAIEAYEAILDYAPDETAARAALNRLRGP